MAPINNVSYQIQNIDDNTNRVLVADSNNSSENRTTSYESVSVTPQLDSSLISQNLSQISGLSWDPVYEQLKNEIMTPSLLSQNIEGLSDLDSSASGVH